MHPTLRDRFVGCLIGHALGDALGAPFEGMPSDVVFREFGPIRQLFANFPLEILHYTDDTEMSIAIARTLIDDGQINPQRLAASFEQHYNPARGYGPGAQRILEAMRAGEDWESLAQNLFPNGSLGNGAAMRAAPVGLRFHRDQARLLEQARLSALPTHRHPVGIEGAQLMAAAVAFVLNHTPFDRSDFFSALSDVVATDEMNYAMKIAAQLSPDDALWTLGNSLEAHRSVPTAIACFSFNPNSYLDTVAAAISLGGDCDTIAAMAGAISGAHLGIAAIPVELIDRLENQKNGRDEIIALAEKLWKSTQDPI